MASPTPNELLDENPLDSSIYGNGSTESIEKRISLLDTVRDSLQRQGKTTMLYRIVLCGGIHRENETVKVDVGGYYQKFFKQYQAENELVTGLFLSYHHSWVHILEASQAVTLALMREMVSASSKNLVKQVKVLLVTEDISNRFYPFWACRHVETAHMMDSEKEVDESLVKGDALIKTITDMIVSLLQVGTQLSSLSKAELKPALEELAEKYKDLIPKPELLQTCLHLPDILTIEEWNKTFDGHTLMDAEEEYIWPAPRLILV